MLGLAELEGAITVILFVLPFAGTLALELAVAVVLPAMSDGLMQ